jgi:hypothetical protein
MNWDKLKERFILLRRFISDSLELYKIGREIGVDIVKRYDHAYNEYLKGTYFYIPHDEREEIIREIARVIKDDKLIEIFNRLKPRDILGIGFRGKYYSYEEGKGLTIENAWEKVKKNILEALNQTDERGHAFLKAIVILHEDGKWSGDYYGASYTDILRVMREISGKPLFPAPRDLLIFKSYRIYYKSGSRKYPTHSIPEEIIPVIKEVLK